MTTQYRSDYRDVVIHALGPLLAPRAHWNKSAIPTIRVTNIPDLLPARGVGGSPLWGVALLNNLNSANSPLDHTHGNFEHILARLSATTNLSTGHEPGIYHDYRPFGQCSRHSRHGLAQLVFVPHLGGRPTDHRQNPSDGL